MEGLLNPVSTSYKSKDTKEDAILVEVPRAPKAITKPTFQASNPEEALEILKNEPDYEALISTLRSLGKSNHDFNITSPSPVASQIVRVLVSETLPNYWDVLYESEKNSKGAKQRKSRRLPDLELFLTCLRSVTGLNAILLSLKRDIQLSKETKKAVGGPNVQDILTVLLQALSALLEQDQSVERIWSAIWFSSDPPQKQRTIWNEFLGLVGGGKILGTAAEAEDIVNDLSQNIGEKYWIADGSLYSSWLARNVSYWAKSLPTDSANGWKCCSELLTKTFRLGYTEKTVNGLLKSLLLQSQGDSTRFTHLLSSLPSFEQRNVLYALLQIISKEHLSTTITTEADSSWWKSDAKVVSGAAGLIKSLITNEESRKTQLLSWLTSSTGAGVGEGIAIRRAVVAALAEDKSDMETVLEKSLQQLGDQLYIKHAPTMQQEVHTQVLLLAAGQVRRKAPLRLAMMMRSGAHLNVVTNRLGSSSPRARFLGMIVGEALSELVDKGDKKMDFKVDEMGTAEAKWYKSLANVSDTIGPLDLLKSGVVALPSKRKSQLRPSKPVKKPPPFNGSSKIISIEEVDDDDEEGESDDDDLVPYAKPDSDPEDSDEDATNIIRDKSTAPVYIRDLITYLRDTDNYDRQKLGLQTAAPLIRRKANFGTEVSSHAEDIATLLVGIQDKYDMDDFQDMRLQGMIAILVALPLKMGQWFSKTFFDGDYSISQRASVLTTLGLGAREIAGFSEEASSLTSSKPQPVPSFPSKTLPENMHKIYASPPSPAKRQLQSTPISTLTTQLSKTMIAPMAASLADKATGPNILKTRTFSSRMAVEAERKKPTTNALAKVVADGFFFPLTGRFFIHLKARSNIAFDPFLLALFLKTIALLLHASGPNNMSLPQMTSEAWDLLLGLRTQATSDAGVLEGLLFAVMVLVEVNSDKRGLVEGYGRQMLEMQGWVEGVFGRLQGVGGEEEEKVRVLAAGVLVRIRECVEKYQTLLLGDLASF
ncbi:DNA replication checkpoint protein [Lachnellula occidentalis]|uniref:DNA replication checkpoint protein n=1 Tax=Lachnellula occidentalis TaxID=215460 RepID=A0A8H8UKG3_9HELO|nr:DNA replication checkpoint protein [Lachnellula occidentalis]